MKIPLNGIKPPKGLEQKFQDADIVVDRFGVVLKNRFGRRKGLKVLIISEERQ